MSANVPIFQAGLIHADVRDAWSRFRQAVLSESLLRRQVFQEVQIAGEDLMTSQGKIRDLQDEVAAAQQAFDLAERSYQLGNASNLDRLTAQDHSEPHACNSLASSSTTRSSIWACFALPDSCTPAAASRRRAPHGRRKRDGSPYSYVLASNGLTAIPRQNPTPPSLPVSCS